MIIIARHTLFELSRLTFAPSQAVEDAKREGRKQLIREIKTWVDGFPFERFDRSAAYKKLLEELK